MKHCLSALLLLMPLFAKAVSGSWVAEGPGVCWSRAECVMNPLSQRTWRQDIEPSALQLEIRRRQVTASADVAC